MKEKMDEIHIGNFILCTLYITWVGWLIRVVQMKDILHACLQLGIYIIPARNFVNLWT